MDFQIKILLLSFALTVVLGMIIVPILRKLKVGQIERSDGPETHLKKQGTPTMGGIIIILGIIIVTIGAYIYYKSKDPELAKNLLPILGLTIGFGLIGFIDDFKKLVLKNTKGIIVPGGFGSRGIEGKIETIKYARENKVPFLGICLGMQMAVVEFARDVLGTIKQKNKEIRSEHIKVNTEFVPAENLAAKNYKWDKEDGYWVPETRNLYNSYFYPVEDPIDPVKKFYYQGNGFATECDGGVALHNNLDEHLTKLQYRKLMDVAVKAGCNYFTFNIPNTVCKKCGHISKHHLDHCEECGSTELDYATRIIGYLKLVGNFSEPRQIEASKRYYAKVEDAKVL